MCLCAFVSTILRRQFWIACFSTDERFPEYGKVEFVFSYAPEKIKGNLFSLTERRGGNGALNLFLLFSKKKKKRMEMTCGFLNCECHFLSTRGAFFNVTGDALCVRTLLPVSPCVPQVWATWRTGRAFPWTTVPSTLWSAGTAMRLSTSPAKTQQMANTVCPRTGPVWWIGCLHLTQTFSLSVCHLGLLLWGFGFLLIIHFDQAHVKETSSHLNVKQMNPVETWK